MPYFSRTRTLGPLLAAVATVSAPGRAEAASPSSPGSSSAAQTSTAGTDSHVNFHINALGLLQFGVAPTLEIGGRHWSTFLRVRPMNSGVASYFLVGTPSEDDNFIFGMGAGVGARGWVLGKGNMRGLFFGGGIEYAYTRVDDDEDDRAQWRTHSIVPLGEFGYRWVFGRFLLGVGLSAGAAIPVGWSDTPVGLDGCFYVDSCDDTRDVFPFGMLRLDIGWMFGG